MTQKELAIEIGLHPQMLSILFTGRRRVGPRTAKRIAAYLKRPDWQTFYHMPGDELRRALMDDKASEIQPTSR